MDAHKVREVMNLYRRSFEQLGVQKVDHRLAGPLVIEEVAFEHCHQMLDKMEEFLDKGDIGKAFRWLGFIQGILCAHGMFDINQLADHSRSE